MKLSQKGKELIREFEGLRLVAYQDGGGVWTIGYGHTGSVDGKKIKQNDTITLKKAQELLDLDVAKFEAHVNSYLKHYSFSQNEFDALVSFAFNLGSINQLTNNGKRSKTEITRKMAEYSNMRIGGNLTWIKGLHVRRLKETLFFLTGK